MKVDDYFETLQFLFSERLILAAFDLIDRESVIRFKTPWGYNQYHVLGSTANYTVFPFRSHHSPTPYCTCPAFAYGVLLSGSEIMCKHLLATMVAIKMSRCIERTLSLNDLAIMASAETGSG
ncbi:hypothetical protein C8Q75DRAFT_713671 [Abortiporus biennis]|nr:hypothetical protein C8Q75DRAFT_713671 [Abortiporus biennis]